VALFCILYGNFRKNDGAPLMARLGAVRVIDAWRAQIRKPSFFCLVVVNKGKY
jgi:hypothetical protein